MQCKTECTAESVEPTPTGAEQVNREQLVCSCDLMRLSIVFWTTTLLSKIPGSPVSPGASQMSKLEQLILDVSLALINHTVRLQSCAVEPSLSSHHGAKSETLTMASCHELIDELSAQLLRTAEVLLKAVNRLKRRWIEPATQSCIPRQADVSLSSNAVPATATQDADPRETLTGAARMLQPQQTTQAVPLPQFNHAVSKNSQSALYAYLRKQFGQDTVRHQGSTKLPKRVRRG